MPKTARDVTEHDCIYALKYGGAQLAAELAHTGKGVTWKLTDTGRKVDRRIVERLQADGRVISGPSTADRLVMVWGGK